MRRDPDPSELLPERTPAEREARRAQLEPTWQKCRAALAATLPELTMYQFIDPMVLVDAESDRLFIAAPAAIGSWARERYSLTIARAASRVAGRRIEVDIYPDPSLPTSGEARSVPPDTIDQEGTTE